MLQTIETLIYHLAYLLILFVMLGKGYRCNRVHIFVTVYIIEAIFLITSPVVDNLLLHGILYIVISYGYIFFMKDNIANRLTAGFAMEGLFNILCNTLLALSYLIISAGSWLDLNEESSHYYIVMSVIVIISMLLTLRVGLWLREFILDLNGRFRTLIFIFVPVISMIRSTYMSIMAPEYHYSPSGIYMVMDTMFVVIIGIFIVLICIFKIKDQRNANLSFKEDLGRLQKDYDNVAELEGEIRIAKHELKNRVIDITNSKE